MTIIWYSLYDRTELSPNLHRRENIYICIVSPTQNAIYKPNATAVYLLFVAFSMVKNKVKYDKSTLCIVIISIFVKSGNSFISHNTCGNNYS